MLDWRKMMSKKFWNWVKNEESRTLYFDGYIAQDSWFDDEITPKQFKSESVSYINMTLPTNREV